LPAKIWRGGRRSEPELLGGAVQREELGGEWSWGEKLEFHPALFIEEVVEMRATNPVV